MDSERIDSLLVSTVYHQSQLSTLFMLDEIKQQTKNNGIPSSIDQI